MIVKSTAEYVTTSAIGQIKPINTIDFIPQPESPNCNELNDDESSYEYQLINTAVCTISTYQYQIFWTWKLTKI
jgi:hypothetical protein